MGSKTLDATGLHCTENNNNKNSLKCIFSFYQKKVSNTYLE